MVRLRAEHGRQHYSPAFTAQHIKHVLHDEKTVGRLAAEHNSHPTQLHMWRSLAAET
jgi:transposase-like protein